MAAADQPDIAGRSADTGLAVDNYEWQTIGDQAVQFRPGPIAGDPAEMGAAIRSSRHG